MQNFNGSQSSKVTSRKAVNKETPFSPVLDCVRSVEEQVTVGQDSSEFSVFYLSVPSHLRSVLILVEALQLPEGQNDKTLKPSNKNMLFLY